jgi:formylmethanofuran dehydrogenase subunit E
MSSHIMAADLSDLFETQKPTASAPEKARILNSLICESCGEATMETRTRKYRERTLCIPCFES